MFQKPYLVRACLNFTQILYIEEYQSLLINLNTEGHFYNVN